MRRRTALFSHVILIASTSLAFAGEPILPQSTVGNHMHAVEPLWRPPYNLDGGGVAVAVFDMNWVDDKHPDLAGRVVADRTLPHFSDPDPSWDKGALGHGTHMAGVIASGGVGNPDAKGAAPAAQIYSYISYQQYVSKNPRFAADEVGLHGWKIANHAYGSGVPCQPPQLPGDCKPEDWWSAYIDRSRDEDAWAWDLDVLSVNSAGNKGLYKEFGDGYEDGNWSTIYGGGTAKNSITVCAADRIQYEGKTFIVKDDSSKGPAIDGRIKPDVCAIGGNAPTTELGGGYSWTNSTSGAVAEVSGIVALLHQQYRRMNGPTSSLPAALARAILLHTAEDMADNTARWDGRAGAGVYRTAHTTPGPDYTTGWGFVNAQAAAEVLSNPTRYTGATIAQTDVWEQQLDIPAHDGVKVTLAWLDPPAEIGAKPALLNDLDLEVEEMSSGTIHLPWVLDPKQPMQPATTGVNHVDNVEQVVFQVEADTRVKVRVKAPKIALGPQTFYVVHTLFDAAAPPASPPDMAMPPAPSGPLPTIERDGCGCTLGGASARGGFPGLVVVMGVAALVLRRRRLKRR